MDPQTLHSMLAFKLFIKPLPLVGNCFSRLSTKDSLCRPEISLQRSSWLCLLVLGSRVCATTPGSEFYLDPIHCFLASLPSPVFLRTVKAISRLHS